jgi:hypothetical protein
MDHYRTPSGQRGRDAAVVPHVQQPAAAATGAFVVGVDHRCDVTVHRAPDQRRLAGARHARHHHHRVAFEGQVHEATIPEDAERPVKRS